MVSLYQLFFSIQLAIKAILLFVLPILLFIMVRKLYKFITVINKDVYQYKIINLKKPIIVVSLYILLIGGVFNILRLFASYKILINGINIDLKPLIKNIYDELSTIYQVNLVAFYYVIIMIILLILIIILLWRSIHQYSLKQLFSLYLYLVGTVSPAPGTMQDLGELREERQRANPVLYHYVRILDKKYFWFSFAYHRVDIIRGIMINMIQYMKNIYWEYYKIENRSYVVHTIPRLLYNLQELLGSNWSNRLFFFSPILFFFYDCLLNDLVINNTIIWMTVFVPLLQLYRITLFYNDRYMYIESLLYDIIYGNEIYTYIVPSKLKSFFDLAIMNKCQYIKDLTVIQNIDFNTLAYEFLFEYDYDREIYINSSGIELKKQSTTIYVQIEEEKEEKIVWEYVAGNKEGYNPNKKTKTK